jgi:hypothetical protein
MEAIRSNEHMMTGTVRPARICIDKRFIFINAVLKQRVFIVQRGFFSVLQFNRS